MVSPGEPRGATALAMPIDAHAHPLARAFPSPTAAPTAAERDRRGSAA